MGQLLHSECILCCRWCKCMIERRRSIKEVIMIHMFWKYTFQLLWSLFASGVVFPMAGCLRCACKAQYCCSWPHHTGEWTLGQPHASFNAHPSKLHSHPLFAPKTTSPQQQTCHPTACKQIAGSVHPQIWLCSPDRVVSQQVIPPPPTPAKHLPGTGWSPTQSQPAAFRRVSRQSASVSVDLRCSVPFCVHSERGDWLLWHFSWYPHWHDSGSVWPPVFHSKQNICLSAIGLLSWSHLSITGHVEKGWESPPPPFFF